MRIYIMRHGDAVAQAKTDAQRPLSDYGRAQAQSMVRYLIEQPPTKLMASPYLRAQQTATLVQQGLAQQGINLPLITAPFITPNDSPKKVIEQLEDEQAERLMLVSHQPLVGSLFTLLVEGHNMGCPVNTASIMCLETEYVGPGQASALWVKQP